MVLLSDAIGMTNDGDEVTFIDTDGNVDDIGGTNVILALALGDPDSVELWTSDRFETGGRVKGGVITVEMLAEFVGMADAKEVPVTVLLKEIVGSPEEGKPPDEVLLDVLVDNALESVLGRPGAKLLLADIVGIPDGAELLENPTDEVFRGGVVPEELLIDMVGTLDGAVMVENPVNELFVESVGNLDAAVDDMVGIIDGLEMLVSAVDEMLEESVGVLDGAKEVL